MRSYQTQIEINAPIEKVWIGLTNFSSYPEWNPIVGKLSGEMKVGNKITTYIVPLGKTYYPKLVAYDINHQLIWLGALGARFLLAGKHYYKLEKISQTKTRLVHGETFTGLLSWFIKSGLLAKMEEAFIKHNNILKNRVEHGKE